MVINGLTGQPCLFHCVVSFFRALRQRVYRVHDTKAIQSKEQIKVKGDVTSGLQSSVSFNNKTQTLMTENDDELEKAAHGLVGSIPPYNRELQKLQSKIDAVQINIDRKAQIHEFLQHELTQGRDDYLLFQVQALKEEAEQAGFEDREKQKHRINALNYRQELEKQIQDRERLRHDAILQAHAIDNLLALEQMRKCDTENGVAKSKVVIEQGSKGGEIAADP